MHEFSIVDALIEQVRQTVERAGQSGRVVRVELAIGRLAGVYCDSIRLAFELLSAGTSLEQAELYIVEPRAVSRCRGCKACVEVDELALKCPECGSMEVSVEGGRELLLQSIEIEEQTDENHHRQEDP